MTFILILSEMRPRSLSLHPALLGDSVAKTTQPVASRLDTIFNPWCNLPSGSIREKKGGRKAKRVDGF